MEKLAAAEEKFAEEFPPVEALRAWLLLFVDYIAAKHLIAPALNALLGELNVRIGLNGPARELLYRASLLKPPTWEAYQRTSLLLRRAEAELTHWPGR